MKNIMKKILLVSLIVITLASCIEQPPVPKPKTYLRLGTPEPQYVLFRDQTMPFEFEYPDYGKIIPIKSDDRASKWFNISFDCYGFEANVSYIPIKNDTALAYMVNDCYTFLDKHKKFSSGIIERQYENTEKQVFGTAFEIKGSEVVSPYQFYITDSSRHFLRLALHCKTAPNNDSLSAYIKRIQTDLEHLISTFSWK
ncbi:MAG: hypothetical protein SOY91_00840 [Candidatus Onthomorpha sp.]|nr:hypothetical protein [Candidatus Onthomorpha sp.]